MNVTVGKNTSLVPVLAPTLLVLGQAEMQGKMATNATTEITVHRFHIATASKLTE